MPIEQARLNDLMRRSGRTRNRSQAQILIPLTREEERELNNLLAQHEGSLLPIEQARLSYLLKKQGITPGKIQRPLGSSTPRPDYESIAIKKELEAEKRARKIEEIQRRVMAGQSIAQIAQQMGISESSVRRLMQR